MSNLIFNESFNVVWPSDKVEELNYFLLNDVPIIDYSKGSRSCCAKIPRPEWKHYDGLFPNDTPAIFLKLRSDDEINWCSLYHELGHIMLGHLDEERQGERTSEVDRGIVSKEELEADAYACEMMGREKTIRWLNLLLDETKRKIDCLEYLEQERENGLCEQEKENLNIFRRSNQEVTLRIKAIENIS